MKQSFNLTAQSFIASTISAIDRHPFITELSEGTLSQKVFNHYLAQDRQYLLVYQTVLKTLSEQASVHEDQRLLARCADAINLEPAQPDNTMMDSLDAPICLTNACHDYIAFLNEHSQAGFILGVSAIYPCFLIYKTLALKHFPSHIEHHPYRDWFSCYSGTDFVNQTDQITQLLARAYHRSDHEKQKAILNTIKTGSDLEYAFFDDAYHNVSMSKCDKNDKPINK